MAQSWTPGSPQADQPAVRTPPVGNPPGNVEEPEAVDRFIAILNPAKARAAPRAGPKPAAAELPPTAADFEAGAKKAAEVMRDLAAAKSMGST